MSEKFIFWSPVDACVEYFLDRNTSVHEISKQHPYIFACSNGIDRLVKARCGPRAITIDMANDMRVKGTASFDLMKTLDFDVCIRLDIDAIVFDLPRLLQLASATGPRQLVGWEIRPGRIRGGCHAVGSEIIRTIAPLGQGPNFDAALSKRTRAVNGEMVHCKLFELNDDYTGECPVWHPRKSEKEPLFADHMERWRHQPDPNGCSTR